MPPHCDSLDRPHDVYKASKARDSAAAHTHDAANAVTEA